MKIQTNQLVFENRECLQCQGTGKINLWVKCPLNNQPLYGKTCRYCGTTRKNDHHQLQTGKTILCLYCNGNGHVKEDEYSFASLEVRKWLAGLPLEIKQQTQCFNVLEQNLGVGRALVTVTDYGTLWNMTKETLNGAEKYLKEQITAHSFQILNILDKGELCNSLICLITPNGWCLKAVFKT
jgi:hypothetical protein